MNATKNGKGEMGYNLETTYMKMQMHWIYNLQDHLEAC